MSIIKKANEFFRAGNYVVAHDLYEQASKNYGYESIDFNIQLCKKRLEQTESSFDSKKDVHKNNYLNQYFDHIYVVNLKHKVADRLKTATHLKKHGVDFEIFEATNGYEGEPLDKYNEYSKRKPGNLKRYSDYNEKEIEWGTLYISSAGAMGYIYTYLRILRDAKEKGYKRFLILEDDVFLSNEFENKFYKFTKIIDKDWKILQLGASQYGWGSVNLTEAGEKGFYVARGMDTKGSFAIAYDSSIIDELIEAQSSFEAPFDHLPMAELYERYLGKCFVAYPYIILPDVSDSSIRGKRCQYQHSKRMKWPLENFDYPLDKPSISIIINNKNNLKYYSQFYNSSDLPFTLRLYFKTVDGMRPLHNLELLEKNGNEIQPISDHVSVPQCDYVATIGENDVLTEEHIIQFIEFKTNIRKENSTPLREIENFHSEVKKGRVSVIIPTYKRPKNLTNALKSVVTQDYHDIEVIIISDNGQDSEFNEETRQIVSYFEDYNPNCKVILIEHNVNRNGAAARNTGILNSTGEYTCFLDDDDIYLEGRLSKSIDKLEKSIKTVGAVYCGFLGWNSPVNDLNRYKTGDLTLEILLLDYMKHYLHTNTATYRRKAILAINGFDESYRRHQDLELNLRFFEAYAVEAVKECLVRLNPEPSDVSNKVFNAEMLELKQKFLGQFKYLIDRFSSDEQYQIYTKHQAEAVKYVKQKEKVVEFYQEKVQDFNAQIVMQLLKDYKPEPKQKKEESSLNHKDIGFYRIIGNNLPGLHANDQSFTNLDFIIKNESNFERVDKYIVLNRLVDMDLKRKLIDYLNSKRIKFLEIDFDSSEFKKIGYDFKNLPDSNYWFADRTKWEKLVLNTAVRESKNRYLMNNNGARNFALNHGRKHYRWTMPWDGNCFLSDPLYQQLLKSFDNPGKHKYIVTPMERVKNNASINSQSVVMNAVEEPQISFLKDTQESFNEERVYGNQPKVELFKRLGFPGVWDEYTKQYPWKKFEYKKSSDVGMITSASAVFRLFSGNVKAAEESKNRSHVRAEGIYDFIDQVEANYIKENLQDNKIRDYLSSYLEESLVEKSLKSLYKDFNDVILEVDENKTLENVFFIYNSSNDNQAKIHSVFMILIHYMQSSNKPALMKTIKRFIDQEDTLENRKINNLEDDITKAFIEVFFKLMSGELVSAVKSKLHLAMLLYHYYSNKENVESYLAQQIESITQDILVVFKYIFEYDFFKNLIETDEKYRKKYIFQDKKTEILKPIIFPIGTCRLYEPLSLLGQDEIIYPGVGYFHTSSQVVDWIKILVGEKSVDKNLIKFMFRKDQTPENPFDNDLFNDEAFDRVLKNKQLLFKKANAIVIEISTTKSHFIEGLHVQGNPNYYHNMTYREAWAEEGYYEKMHPDLRVMRYNDIDRLYSNFKYLNELLIETGKIAVVTGHLYNPNNPSVSRKRHNNSLELAVKKLGNSQIVYYENTHLLSEFGYRVKQDGTTDINHLPVEAFRKQSEEIYELVLNTIISKQMMINELPSKPFAYDNNKFEPLKTQKKEGSNGNYERVDTKIFLAQRTDGFGERLRAILNAKALANYYSAEFKFSWEPMHYSVQDMHSIASKELTFSENFIEDYHVDVNNIHAHCIHKVEDYERNLSHEKIRYFNVTQTTNISKEPFLKKAFSEINLADIFFSINFSAELEHAINFAQHANIDESSIAIHLRAGDIMYGVYRCTDNYVDKAIPYTLAMSFIKMFLDQGYNILLFGQDNEFCQFLVKEYNATYADSLCPKTYTKEQRALFDIVLMSKCSKVIAGPSGFSTLACNIGNVKRLDSRSILPKDKSVLSTIKMLKETFGGVNVPSFQVAFACNWAISNGRDFIEDEDFHFLVNLGFENDPSNYLFVFLKAIYFFKINNTQQVELMLHEYLSDSVHCEELINVIEKPYGSAGNFSTVVTPYEDILVEYANYDCPIASLILAISKSKITNSQKSAVQYAELYLKNKKEQYEHTDKIIENILKNNKEEK